MTIGQPFNPFGLFNGIYIPEALLKAKSLSLGAKVVYGRLTRYAGENGLCYPAMDTLAAEIGLEARQTRRYISELEEFGLLRRVKRFSGTDHAQTSNGYEFLGHVIFADSLKVTGDVTGGPMTDTTSPPMTDTTAKDSHVLRESRFKKELQHLERFETVRAREQPAQDDDWINNVSEPEPKYHSESASPAYDEMPNFQRADGSWDMEAYYAHVRATVARAGGVKIEHVA